MGYVRTAGMSTAGRRRRRRTALVLTGLLILLIAVFAYAAAYFQGWLPTDDGATGDREQVTATATATALKPEEVKVNVYNATDRSGLAGRTGEALEARGYDVQDIADDPEQSTVEGAAHIRFGPAGADAADAMHELVPAAELLQDDRESAEIDLVLGPDFEELPEAGEDGAADPTATGEDG